MVIVQCSVRQHPRKSIDCITSLIHNISCWLVVDLPLCKIWKSVGIIIPNIWKNNPMFQTITSAVFVVHCLLWLQSQQVPQSDLTQSHPSFLPSVSGVEFDAIHLGLGTDTEHTEKNAMQFIDVHCMFFPEFKKHKETMFLHCQMWGFAQKCPIKTNSGISEACLAWQMPKKSPRRVPLNQGLSENGTKGLMIHHSVLKRGNGKSPTNT